MCQLTLVNLGDGKLNSIFLAPLLQLNSLGNQDGTGFLAVQPDEVTLYKTEQAADEIEELGMDIREHIGKSKYPIMAHVRAASRGIVVTKENAHPFQGDRFFLAHNGRLYGKDEKVSYSGGAEDTGLESDSLRFLQALEAEAVKAPDADMLTLMNSAMSQFMGKFALMVYDSLNDKHYVARGSTADLHILPVSTSPLSGGELAHIGFVVNTKKTSLSDVGTMFAQIAQIVTGKRIFMGKIEELDKNTLYVVNGAVLDKVGELKEVPVTYYTPAYTQTTGKTSAKDSVNLLLPIWKMSERIYRFMEEHYLSIPDMDAIFFLFLGVCMGDATKDDMERFINVYIQKLSASKDIKKSLGKVLVSGTVILPYIYERIPELQYPWMLSEKKDVTRMINLLADMKKKA